MIWITSMFLNDWDMLQCHLEAAKDIEQVVHVVTESPQTHRGEPKPLHLQENPLRWAREWGDRLIPVTARDLPTGEGDHWGREHAQRNAAWPAIARHVPGDDDAVLICDGDEIPSRELLDFLPRWAKEPGSEAISIPMRTCLFAVDWEVTAPLPPTCVAATMGYLRKRAAAGQYLAQVRDGRDSYPLFPGFGGWHLSWIGGPERQREKLLKTTCHVELLGLPEGELIASGERWRTAQDGGGLSVTPVDVDESWPPFVYELRCPENWFRPRGGRVSITEEYEQRVARECDIQGHMWFMRETVTAYAAPRIIELGVRTGESTSCFLAAIEEVGGELWSVDKNDAQVPEHWRQLPHWHFLQADDCSPEALSWVSATCDVLFVDTSHERQHTDDELKLYMPRVRPGGVALFHDTLLAKEGGPEGTRGHVWDALDAYCGEHGLVWENREGSFGMGVVRL